MDYFALFGLPYQFSLDITHLTKIYKNLQKKFHPDCFVRCSEFERLQAVEHSAKINQAWQTLRSPLARAEYLLSLHGLDMAKEHTISDTDFLTEQLHLRENLEYIEHSCDRKQLSNFIQMLNIMIKKLYGRIEKELNNTMWHQAACTTCKLRFLDKIQASAENLEEKLLDL